MIFRTRDLTVSVTPAGATVANIPCFNVVISQITPPCRFIVVSFCDIGTVCRFRTLVTCVTNTIITCLNLTGGCLAGTVVTCFVGTEITCGGGTLLTDPIGGGDPLVALRQLREQLQQSLAAVEAQEKTTAAGGQT